MTRESAQQAQTVGPRDDSEDDELEDEVLVNEAEELEQVNESAFTRLMASSIDESSEARPIQNATRKDSGSSRKTEKRQWGTLNFFPRKGKPKDSTTGQPEEAEDGEGESLSAMPAIDLEEKFRSKASDLTGQNATRHQAVLRFPYCQKTQSLALQVARCFNRGRWFAYELELSWKKTGRFQPENKGGETMAHR
ncbi:hypothetical protein V8E54_009734 [Elaphomyces granulatus]